MIKNLGISLLLSAVLALPLSGGTLPIEPAHAQACLSNAEARDAVRSGAARPLADVRRQVLRDGGRIVNAQLCRSGRGLVYVISVLRANGRVANVTVPAR